MQVSHVRRRTVGMLARIAALWPLWPLAAARAQALVPTPAVTVGPFYPPDPTGLPFFRAAALQPLPQGNDLTKGPHGRPAEGQPIRVGGRILDTAGRPIANARIEIWQVDARGHYAVEVGADRDPDFAGYGTDTSDATGQYRFTTVRPAAYARYGGLIRRSAHVHVRVSAPSHPPLATELWFADEPGNARDSFAGRIDDPQLRERMQVRLQPQPDGPSLALFDIVLPETR
jgi:protocatechuate 3,4-dioxygenase beta subunit